MINESYRRLLILIRIFYKYILLLLIGIIKNNEDIKGEEYEKVFQNPAKLICGFRGFHPLQFPFFSDQFVL